MSRNAELLPIVNRPLFVPFVTAGDPNEETTIQLAIMLQEIGADALELGIPYSDPLADGPVIQRASLRALKNGMSLQKALELVGKMRERGLKIPVIIFTYYNLLLQLTVETFIAEAKQHGIDGLLIPDLPFEEGEELREACKTINMPLISLVAPTTTDQRLEQIGRSAQGFLYCVSSLGVTGVRQGFDTRLKSFLKKARLVSEVPVLVGFGVSKHEHIVSLSDDCDGVIVGSAIVKQVEQYANELVSQDKIPMIMDKIRQHLQAELLNNGEVFKENEGTIKDA